MRSYAQHGNARFRLIAAGSAHQGVRNPVS